ncbi:MAG: 16S rRNA (adenine(1518)-N(6)/adenine(1519)-N(6))-dimethyltransferase RsmA, partial [Acidimicrobiales bacterium]
MNLSGTEISDLMNRYGIKPSRALGQNFVVDPNTIDRIVRLAGIRAADRVVEIGAGLGSLTLGLASTGARVVAIELDRRLVGVLDETVVPTGVKVIHGDAMTLDWENVLGGDGQEWKLVANLPYNIATPLLIGLLEGVPRIVEMLVMVQKEVGERLVAGVDQTGYGAVSVKMAYWAEAKLAGRVPASVFVPRPKVDSVLVSVKRRDPIDPLDPHGGYERLFTLVRAG